MHSCQEMIAVFFASYGVGGPNVSIWDFTGVRYDALRDSIYFLSSGKKGDQANKVQERLTGENSELSEEDVVEDSKIPADIQGLLHFSTPLFQSQNSAVVLAVAGLYWVFAPRKDVKSIVKPLLFLLRSSYDSQYVVSLQLNLLR